MLQVAGLVGLAVGFVAGAWLAPHAATSLDPTLRRRGGSRDGPAPGRDRRCDRFRPRAETPETSPRRPLQGRGRVGGSALSAGALVLAIWFLGLNLAAGPFPSVARSLQHSAVVRVIDSAFPPPPSLAAQLGNVLDLIGFPDVFSGLPPLPAEPGAAARSGSCRPGGASGPPIGGADRRTGVRPDPPGHRVRRRGRPRPHQRSRDRRQQPEGRMGGRTFAAVPVVFDRDLDAAVLRVDGLDAPALTLLTQEVRRGTGGAVLGYPHGRYTERRAAARRALDAVGRDIYSEDQVRRRIYELQVTVKPGNSGGPFVLPGGKVAGSDLRGIRHERGPGVRAHLARADPVGRSGDGPFRRGRSPAAASAELSPRRRPRVPSPVRPV